MATAKRILRQPDPHLALMSYRATPISATGLSPAQLMIGRQLRTTVPILPKQLNPSPIDYKTVRRKDQQTKAAYRFFYNRRHSTQPLPALQPGQSVNIKLDGKKSWKLLQKSLPRHQSPGLIMCRRHKACLPAGTGDTFRWCKSHLCHLQQ